MISDEQLTEHLNLMASTDDAIGEAWGRVKATEHLVKQYRSMAFLESQGTVAEREHKSSRDPQVIKAQDDYADAEREYKTIWAKRETAKYHIEVWRSQNSARKHGHV